MPIKFRCSYCRQFLGISRGRAGDVVDCPTCGRSIRVPGLDGVVQPVPTPELNVRDAKLLRALDELANWNAPQPVAATATAEAEAEEEIPQPIAEPIPIEVPIAPEPIAVKPPPSVEPVSAGPQTAATGVTAEPAMTVAAALVELNQIATVEQPRPQTPAAPFLPVASRRPLSPRLAVIGGLCLAAISFAGGYLVSRVRAPAVGPSATGDQNGPNANETILIPAISGRISYKTADGSSLADRGARVLILPREREGTAKLSAAGFRAGDNPADVRLATAALRALGGDLAVTDDGGKFTLQLANPGTFHVVVISNYATRGNDDEIDPELIRLLTPYFDQPAQVLGRTKVHFGQVRYKGTGTEIWDHSF